jgi:hypothetical protein
MPYYRSKYILIPEPALSFSGVQSSYISISPLEGLTKWGPYDASIPGFIQRPANPIRLAVIAVSNKVNVLKKYLQMLTSETKLLQIHEYLRDYKGFKQVYGLNLDMPDNLTVSINSDEIENCRSAENGELVFLELIKGKLKMLADKREQFDLIILFVTSEMKDFEEVRHENYYFDFHDQLKAYSAPSNLKLQLIREERIPSLKNVGDYVRKLWWLSSAIYTKAGGILYKL